MKVKKSDISFLIILILLCGVSIYSYMTYSYNEELLKTIDKKDKILGDLLLKDSVHNEAQKKYSKNIDKYVEDCSYIVDGKKVNSEGILEIIDKLYIERFQKNDSLRYYIEKEKSNEKYLNFFVKNFPQARDSLAITKSILRTIEKNILQE